MLGSPRQRDQDQPQVFVIIGAGENKQQMKYVHFLSQVPIIGRSCGCSRPFRLEKLNIFSFF